MGRRGGRAGEGGKGGGRAHDLFVFVPSAASSLCTTGFGFIILSYLIYFLLGPPHVMSCSGRRRGCQNLSGGARRGGCVCGSCLIAHIFSFAVSLFNVS